MFVCQIKFLQIVCCYGIQLLPIVNFGILCLGMFWNNMYVIVETAFVRLLI